MGPGRVALQPPGTVTRHDPRHEGRRPHVHQVGLAIVCVGGADHREGTHT